MKGDEPLLAVVPVPAALPKREGLCCAVDEAVPNKEDVVPPLAGAPTFPKRPPEEPVPAFGLLAVPKRLPPDVPDEAGGSNEKSLLDMVDGYD